MGPDVAQRNRRVHVVLCVPGRPFFLHLLYLQTPTPYHLTVMLLFFPLKQYIPPTVSFPSIPTSAPIPLYNLFPFPLDTLLSLQKRAGFPRISTKKGIASYNKTKHKLSYQGWARQLSVVPRSQEPSDSNLQSQHTLQTYPPSSLMWTMPQLRFPPRVTLKTVSGGQ